MGIEVVPFESLQATRSFSKLEKAQHESPWKTTMKDAHSLFHAPTGMPLYLDNTERAGWLKQLGFTFGTNTRMQEVRMTYDIEGGCHLVSINMVVDFAALSLSKGKVEADDLLHLHAGNTSYRFVSNTQPELMYVKLALPVVSGATLWSDTDETKEQTKNLDSKTETTTRTGTFDAAAYQSEVRKMLTTANDGLCCKAMSESGQQLTALLFLGPLTQHGSHLFHHPVNLCRVDHQRGHRSRRSGDEPTRRSDTVRVGRAGQ